MNVEMTGIITTAAIIPCYRAPKTAKLVAEKCANYVDLVICVDDCCPEKTGMYINEKENKKNIVVIHNKSNKGVGGATKVGFKYAIEKKIDILVKIDADGQMEPGQIPELINKIVLDNADISKGNRFRSIEVLNKMPLSRLIGNVGLSFITKVSTGYWELFDPTNGFIAISAKALELIPLDKIDNRYFFETDLLFRAGIADLVIDEIKIPTQYENHVSSLDPRKELFSFGKKHIRILPKRILYQYFLLDFNPGSCSLLMGSLFIIIATLIGIASTYIGMLTGEYTRGGTLTIFLSSLLIGFQLIIAFIYYDVTQRVLMRALKRSSRSR